MPNLGGTELVILILIIVVIFGWKKLPDAARSLGRSMRIFKAEVEEMKHDKDGPSQASRETVQGQTVNPQQEAGYGSTYAPPPSSGAAPGQPPADAPPTAVPPPPAARPASYDDPNAPRA